MLPLGSKQKYSFTSDLRAVWDIVGGSWLNWLLLCAPLGFASEMLGWGATITFSLVSCDVVISCLRGLRDQSAFWTGR
jgi:hypothetical protein